ncbi:flagellar basal body-associated FliL family protein [Methylomonas sp. LL1]|uniref:flagellar basal body-associated FliL family protein n=1 Tax=Methylomonas sp. LL1 TaxID=2785785 RepID=UPI0018C41B7C|nr:flagellar basal body-associated FliL family protein [Methylomonas sp. LL1]QPK62137.1 flagellar basal body-associated FliL family protein [Methylomonas sp. LL1]
MAETKPSEKKISTKLIIIIVLAALLLLLAGGGAGYFFFMKQSSETAHGQVTDGEGGKNEAAKPAEIIPEVYYDLAAPLLVNFPPGSSAKIIKVSLSVLVESDASVGVLKKHEPMIRNNLLMAISSIGADKAKTLEGKQELQAMMLNEIGKVMEKMAGKNTAKDVYFTEFVLQ